jgi:hypothetical protein
MLAPTPKYLINPAMAANAAGSVFGLDHEEYPLVLSPAREERAEAAGTFAARLGAYVA